MRVEKILCNTVMYFMVVVRDDGRIGKKIKVFTSTRENHNGL